jgi:menaquinone C8-methyltransferase
MNWHPGVRFETPDPAPDAEWVLARFGAPPGLYVHVPFCTSLCPFCPYNRVRYRPDLASAYADALMWEAETYLAVGAGPFASLYVGGGTPTLCLDLVGELVARVEVTAERAIEVLPSHLTDVTAQRLTDIGFDAVSLGVQSFDSEVLRHLRRPTTPAQNLAAVDVAVGRFACVDVDLIFDVVVDRPDVLLADLATCFERGVDQVSTYPLMRFGYTPFGKARHQPALEHRLLRRATELAADHGYERRSVWTFNRVGGPTYSSITRDTYLGIGAGAASSSGEVFLLDHFGLAPYLAAVDHGQLPIARVARLAPTAASAYRLFWQLYTGSLPPGYLAGLPAGRRLAVASIGAAKALGWVAPDGDVIRLTPTGYDRYHDLERWITYRLIEPLWAEMMEEHGADPGRDRASVLVGS